MVVVKVPSPAELGLTVEEWARAIVERDRALEANRRLDRIVLGEDAAELLHAQACARWDLTKGCFRS